MPRQPSAVMRDSSGRIAASVLPPAVGANARTCSPARIGSIACSCRGRSEGHPSEFTTWCCNAGCRRSNPLTERNPSRVEIEIDIVGGETGGGIALDVGQLGCAHLERVVGARVEVGVFINALEHVDQLLAE